MKPQFSPGSWGQLFRNPRYAVLLTVGLILVIFSFTAWHRPDTVAYYTGYNPAVYQKPPTPAAGKQYYDPIYGDLRATLEFQEEVYQDHIRQRHELIKKWGPKLENITSFPTNGKFYTVWDFIIPAFSCPFPVRRIGTLGDGGKWVCGFDRVVKQPECVVYSFGVERESSFEAEILTKSQSCKIYGYDYSVSEWGPQLRYNPAFQNRISFNPYKLGGHDIPDSNPPMHTLEGLMKMNGHTFIDILKIDIEGSEFDVLGSLMDAYEGRTLPFGQLQIEIHLWGINFQDFLSWWERLESHGLRPFWTEPNLPSINVIRGEPSVLEWSFINTRGHHALINE
jgi:hypothetical protein